MAIQLGRYIGEFLGIAFEIIKLFALPGRQVANVLVTTLSEGYVPRAAFVIRVLAAGQRRSVRTVQAIRLAD